MIDLIERQVAIDSLNEVDDGASISTAITVVEGLPSAQPEPQWIPCSERLPKPYEYCLWTTTDGRVVYHHCDGLFSSYIAWMPLPEPYQEGEKNEL